MSWVFQLDNLQKALGLHERVEIIYVVDGYEAIFSTQDGNIQVASARGTTVVEALTALSERVKDFDRKEFFKENPEPVRTRIRETIVVVMGKSPDEWFDDGGNCYSLFKDRQHPQSDSEDQISEYKTRWFHRQEEYLDVSPEDIDPYTMHLRLR